MTIYFIRHGDPNYKDNCLTPLGHLQAEALAERIEKSSEKPSVIYSSSYGRAYETAEHTANKLGMEINVLDFIHEITTGKEGMTPDEKKYYSPWLGTVKYAEQGINLATVNPEDCDIYTGTRFPEHDKRVVEGFDNWIETLGFKREGLGYRCIKENHQRIFIYAHGGSISCILGHFLNTNSLHACCFFRIKCTGISKVVFKAKEGDFIVPQIETIDDHSHMTEIEYTEADN